MITVSDWFHCCLFGVILDIREPWRWTHKNSHLSFAVVLLLNCSIKLFVCFRQNIYILRGRKICHGGAPQRGPRQGEVWRKMAVDMWAMFDNDRSEEHKTMSVTRGSQPGILISAVWASFLNILTFLLPSTQSSVPETALPQKQIKSASVSMDKFRSR